MAKALKRIISVILILLHLATFGPMREAIAFSAESASFKLSSGATSAGGLARSAITAKLWQDSMGETCVGKAQSVSYSLNSGLICTLQTNPPVLTQRIPYQTWQMNSAKPAAFDLDDYFSSPHGYALTYTVTGNSNINVDIDPATHAVSFSQAADWSGVEHVYFWATDTQHAATQSNCVVLQVQNTAGQNKPVVVDSTVLPSLAMAGDSITITVRARDLDNDALSFTYSDFFTETRKWSDGTYWYSEATWQTGAASAGHYSIGVTVKDAGNLTDVGNVIVNVGSFNHPPLLDPIPDITANELDLVTITPHATDPDNDAIYFYYSAPFDSQGKWLTNYDSAGVYAIKVIASDGIDTVSRDAKVTINNINRAPVATLTLSKYTVAPKVEFEINLAATDPDGDAMTYVLNKDGAQIASGSISTTYGMTASFSGIGSHSISASVTDSGGKTAFVTRAVDVADPYINRNAINPVMGDFNGDALTDLGMHNSDTGTWEVCLSDHGVFRAASTWASGLGVTGYWWPVGGDFNGDAKSDAGVYNPSTGELKIALSTGSGFATSSSWLTFPNASSSWLPFTGNFNGDKYTDFALYNKDTGEVKVALGTGTGFAAISVWSTGFGTDYTAMGGDFNGDSLTDLCLFKKSTGEFKVAFSNTKVFVDGASWISGYASDKDALVSDFNNDGLTDVGYWDSATGMWYYALSTGTKFVSKGVWLSALGTASDESATTGDFDGNGVLDAACFDRDALGINRWKVRLSTDKPADFLNLIDNGIGGQTQIAYTYAAESGNTDLPFPVYVTQSVSSINTVNTYDTYTQNFSYSGGYFDTVEREFRGFAKVTVTDPITNNYSETYFLQGKPGQDEALKGQIDKIISYDGNARKISEAFNTYEVRKAGPQDRFLGFPALVQQLTTVYEENASFITTKDTITYDNIGNVITQENVGDVAKTGDEKSASTTYAQAYEVGFNRPLEAMLKDKDGNLVSRKNMEYDIKGNLLKETAWLNTQEEQPTSHYSYDMFGNVVSSTNALGSTVTTEYETDFYAFPKKITNSLGHTVQYVYDPKLGQMLSVTDANGVVSTSSFDSLGRPLRGTKDDGTGGQVTVVTYSYPDFNTKVTTNALGLVSVEYIDGLGRKYKAVSSGEDGASARSVTSEVYYNVRGQVDHESLAHYIDEDPAQISYVRYEYDIRGRIKKTHSDFPGTAKDAFSSVSYLEPLYGETTDPQGHRKGTRKDIFGNVVEVTEFTQGGVYTTKYNYDVQGNLLKTTDALGNLVQLFYDSLGRKVKMIDSDMGQWLYEYDILGNLKKQTDAKGAVLEFEYDALNRLVKKSTVNSPQSTVLAEYIYDDASKANCIGRLSKVIDQSGSTEFFYDRLGREVKSTKSIDATPYTVERTYDTLDRLATLKYPDGEVVTYTYDANSGALEKVQGAAVYVQNIDYNAKGQIKAMQYGNNVQTDYTYGTDLRLSQILTQGAASLQNLNYDFDKNGNLKTLSDNLRSCVRTYTYDDLDRLTLAENTPAPGGGNTNFSFQYDAIGNMIYKSDLGAMSYGVGAGPHALTGAGGYSYTYDANGNMGQGKNKTMSYDAENRLRQVNQSGTITSYAYDGDGGRVKKSTANGPQSTDTVYIGSLFEITSDQSGTTTTKHIFAGATRVASVSLRGGQSPTKQTFYYHSDHLGSSNVVTDQSGAQVEYCEYTPYGSLARNEGTDAVKYKFTGKELDATGLYYYGARYYDPEIGRFISADTIVQAPFNPQTLNRYSYCGNNPINYVDPTGHWFWIAIAAIVGAILGGVSAARNGGSIWQGALIGAAMGALSAYSIGSSTVPLILKLAAGFSMLSQVAGAMPGSTWSSISQYSGYAGMALSAGYVAWNVGTGVAAGVKDWAVGKGTYYDVASGTKLTAEEIAKKYGEEGVKIFVNGITEDLQRALDLAKRAGTDVLFYNPTNGAIADVTESALGWLTNTESLSRQLGQLITQLRVDLIGYSQGSIISTNALLYAGLSGGAATGSTIRNFGSAIGRIRLSIVGGISGATVYPNNVHSLDVMKLFSSEVNPIGYAEGAAGILFGGNAHTSYW